MAGVARRYCPVAPMADDRHAVDAHENRRWPGSRLSTSCTFVAAVIRAADDAAAGSARLRDGQFHTESGREYSLPG